MTRRLYLKLLRVYEERHGEPLYADASWCEPLLIAAEGAAELVMEPGPLFEDEVEREAVERAADAIAVLTYGAGFLTRDARVQP